MTVSSLSGKTFARHLVITRPGEVQLIERQLPALGPSEVLARTVLSGISHGTELTWFRGHAAALYKAWNQQARLYHDEGAPRAYPIAPGYETVAAVEAIGQDVNGLAPGSLIYLDRPHADLHVVDSSEAARGILPAGVTAEQAVFYPLARVALGGVHDAGIRLGDMVVITGLGVVGLLASQLARLAGAIMVVGIDRYRLRLEAAHRLGVHVIDATQVTDPAARVRDLTSGRGADAVIEASGSYQVLHQAIRCAMPGGRVATVASYHGDQRGLSLGEEYQRNRITLVASMTIGGVPHCGYPAWDLDRLNATARALVNNDTLDGMADTVISQIPVSAESTDWKTSLRQMALTARSVMLRHPWAPRTVEAQAAPGPAALHYVNAVLGILREDGFSIAQTHHALHILGSRLLGFTQDLFDDSGDLDPEAAAALASALGASHPYVVEMALAVTHGGALGRCDDDAEFEFALDFILDGLARLHSG